MPPGCPTRPCSPASPTCHRRLLDRDRTAPALHLRRTTGGRPGALALGHAQRESATSRDDPCAQVLQVDQDRPLRGTGAPGPRPATSDRAGPVRRTARARLGIAARLAATTRTIFLCSHSGPGSKAARSPSDARRAWWSVHLHPYYTCGSPTSIGEAPGPGSIRGRYGRAPCDRRHFDAWLMPQGATTPNGSGKQAAWCAGSAPSTGPTGITEDDHLAGPDGCSRRCARVGFRPAAAALQYGIWPKMVDAVDRTAFLSFASTIHQGARGYGCARA